ncbi:MAG: hypothetical protein P1P74_11615 [Desulfuromonadales bacterium]|nr:hypothetical protein [Desulfuromonadales bacterium]
MKSLTRIIISSIFVSALAAGLQTPAQAAKATFRAGVTPSSLPLTVNAQGGITGARSATVDVHRTQNGSSFACNKIQTVEVIKGTDPLPLDATQTLTRFAGFPDRKGRCYFDINLTVQPFTDDEIRGVCNAASGSTQTLRMDGLVTAWNQPPNYIDYLRDMRSKGGMGGYDPKNRARIQFVAQVQCANPPAGGSDVPPPTVFNMQGWWKLSTGIPSRDGAWKFMKTQLTQAQGKFSTSGPSTMRNGQLIQGDGRGNATLNANQQFSWSFSDRVTCSGKINNTNSIIVGTCRPVAPNAQRYSFTLEKVNGPVDTGVQSPVTNPRTTPNGVKPIPEPQKPGDTFTPRPPLPPKPRW